MYPARQFQLTSPSSLRATELSTERTWWSSPWCRAPQLSFEDKSSCPEPSLTHTVQTVRQISGRSDFGLSECRPSDAGLTVLQPQSICSSPYRPHPSPTRPTHPPTHPLTDIISGSRFPHAPLLPAGDRACCTHSRMFQAGVGIRVGG